MSLIPHRIPQRMEIAQRTIATRLTKYSKQSDFSNMNAAQLRDFATRYAKHRPTPNPDRAIAMQNCGILERHAQDTEDALKDLDVQGRMQYVARAAIQDALEPSTLTRVMAAVTGVQLPLIEQKQETPKLLKMCDSQLAKTLHEYPERVAQISEAYRAKMTAEEWCSIVDEDYQLIQHIPHTTSVETLKSVAMHVAKSRPQFLEYYADLRIMIADEKFDCDIYDMAITAAIHINYVDVLRYIPAAYQTFDRLMQWIEHMPHIIGYAAYDKLTNAELLQIAVRLMNIDPTNAPKILLMKNYHEYLIGQDQLLCRMIEACPSCVRYHRASKVFTKTSYWFMAVKRCPEVYKLLPEHWRACETKEALLLAMCATKLCPKNILYMKNQPECCIELAVKLDPCAAQYIQDETLAKKYSIDRISADLLGSKTTAVQLD
jgi:hypothetical protein